MSINLIIFDLDGTLIDSRIDITNALNYALEPYGLEPFSVGETVKLIGEGITRLIEKVLNDRDGSLKAAVMERFLDHYSRHILDSTTEYPGVRETLERLNTYKKAVISNKKESLSRMVLDGLGLSGFFDMIIGSDTVPEKKPSPMPVLKVLSELHILPADALIVGDSNYDIDAGRAAGILTVAVTYGYRPLEVIRHADYLIDSMSELVPLLQRVTRGEG
jgi:phosphoglycolate phosphatase